MRLHAIKKTYQQGLEKLWSRRDRFDFYYPALANISEQPVKVKEIYALDSNPEAGEAVWGYNEAWADYRYKPSQVTGKNAFRRSWLICSLPLC